MSVKKMRLIFAFLLIILILSAGLVSCGPGTVLPRTPAAQKPQQVVLKFAGTLPVNHHLTKAAETFKNLVDEKSNGTIKIEHYPAGQLYRDKDLVNVLPEGAVDMADLQPDFWTGLVPSSTLYQFLTFFSDYEHYWRAIEGEPGKIIDREFEERANVKPLVWLDYGDIELISKMPIESAEDVRRHNLRSFGEGTSLWLQALGAFPVSISSGEVYSALQRGTIDGAISGPTSFIERKWYEVCKYMTEVPLTHTAHVFAINIDSWQKLSKEQQKIIMEALEEVRAANKAGWSTAEKTAKEELLKRGVKIHRIPEAEVASWRTASNALYQKTLSEKMGPDRAKELLDATEALREK